MVPAEPQVQPVQIAVQQASFVALAKPVKRPATLQHARAAAKAMSAKRASSTPAAVQTEMRAPIVPPRGKAVT
jgi:hypothetical protein